MRDLSRVVWEEGMHLAQHHFQVQSRYFEDSIQFALSQLFYKSYGLVGCELDDEALRNGTVSLVHARGVMPDGLPFHMPDGDALPAPLEIRELFSPTQDSHLVIIVIPPYRRDAANCTTSDNGATRDVRYVTENNIVLDETTGRDEKPVVVGRKNFRLALDITAPAGAVALPIARVKRDGAGSFVYDPDYIPPAVQIGASERLMRMLRRLVEVLDAKSEALTAGRRGGRAAGGGGDFAGYEVATFWLLHTLHASLAPLRYHFQVRQSHPEQLFTELSRLAGALCTFALESHPRTLPAYDHDNLEVPFSLLERHIREHLEIIIPTTRVEIALQQTAPFYYMGGIVDKRVVGRARWFFGIRSAVGEAEVIRRVPQFVKICSAGQIPGRGTMIELLVQRALPGMTLEHVPIPPPAISPRLDTQYFAVSRAGPCWDHLVQSNAVGLYVPDALPSPEIELVAVVEA